MSYFRFGPFTVDTQAPVLQSGSGEITLEPQVHEFLLFLCRNADSVVTRDQIVDAIWRGGIVSDNAVSKLVARLRNALGDDARNSVYIQTVSRRGYRLTAHVTPADQAGARGTTGQDGRRAPRAVFGSLAVVIVILAWGIGWPPAGQDEGTLPVQPLTRHSGSEFTPAISPDGRFLAYTRRASASAENELWLKDLDSGRARRLSIGSQIGNLLAWAPSGLRLAALVVDPDGGRVRELVLDETGDVVGSRELLSCDGQRIGDLLYSPDGKRLFYASRSRAFRPMQILSHDLEGGESTLLPQPPLEGAGNYALDLSPDGEKLLMVSADRSYRSRLHVLTLENGTLDTHARRNHFLSDAIWHHDNETVIELSAPLGYELVQSSLDGQALRTLVSTSSRIIEFSRHPNGEDIYFASFQMDNDLLHLDWGTGRETPLDNTAVYEHLPALASGSGQYAFQSNRTGHAQAYLGTLSEPGSRKLTQFDESLLFVSLGLSPDASKLVLATYSELLVLATDSGAPLRSTVTDGLILSASWMSNDLVSVSQLVDDQPRLTFYDIAADRFETAGERWSAATAAPDAGQDWYLVDQEGRVFRTDRALDDSEDTGLVLAPVFGLTGLNLNAADHHLYHQQNDGLQSTILRYDPASRESEAVGSWSYVAGFTASPMGLIVSHEVGRVGDIVSTVK